MFIDSFNVLGMKDCGKMILTAESTYEIDILNSLREVTKSGGRLTITAVTGKPRRFHFHGEQARSPKRVR